MSEFFAPSLKELLYQQAEKYADKTFIKFVRDGKIETKSYNCLKNHSNAVCRYIRSISNKKMHVAVVGKTNYEYITCISGIIMSGSVVIPFAPEISKEDASELFQSADIDLLVYDNNFADNIEYIKQNCKNIRYYKNLSDKESFEELYETYSDESEYKSLSDFEVNKKECCLIIYTSGTTGIRKGVMLSSDCLVGNIMYKDYCSAFNEHESAMSVLPMHHVFCFSGDFIKNLKDGVQLCLSENLSDLLKNLNLFQPYVMRVVPTIAQHLLQRIKFVINKNPDMSKKEAVESVLGKNLKWLISGGAYLTSELVDEFAELGISLRQGYGMTEAGCRISVPDEKVSKESVGRVIEICRVRIQNEEIQVDTPTKMLGYYKMPEETKEMFTDDGWLKTGDIGQITEDGQLFVTGRVKNLIILSNGENVSPEAIEKKFNAFPIINEVMVYGEKDFIVAEIFPDSEYAESNNIADIKQEIENIVDNLNANAESSHYISITRLRDEPFEKTSSGKIKRNKSIVYKKGENK